MLNRSETLQDIRAMEARRRRKTPQPHGESKNNIEGEYTAVTLLSKITHQGDLLVRSDPDLTQETMSRLIQTEAENISVTPELNDMLKSMTSSEIYEHVFLENNNTGLVHLSQCITDDMNQSLASLVDKYSCDRNIPFIAGAVYIQAYLRVNHTLYYYVHNNTGKYDIVKWAPKSYAGYIQNFMSSPPRRTGDTKRKAASDRSKVTEGLIPECPFCGSPTIISRILPFGYTNMQGPSEIVYKVFCTDPGKTCILSDGYGVPQSINKAVYDFKEFAAKCKRSKKFLNSEKERLTRLREERKKEEEFLKQQGL